MDNFKQFKIHSLKNPTWIPSSLSGPKTPKPQNPKTPFGGFVIDEME